MCNRLVSSLCFILLSSFRVQGLLIRKLLKMGGKASKAEYDNDMYNKPVEGVTLTDSINELNGRKINVSRWSPVSAKAIVFVSHGLHEHGMRYYRVAESLVAKNYLVIAIDHASHGLSQGDRGLITDYTFLPSDFIALAKNVHQEYPNLPCFILAHSMGTLVATLSVGELPFVKVGKYCIFFAVWAIVTDCHWVLPCNKREEMTNLSKYQIRWSSRGHFLFFLTPGYCVLRVSYFLGSSRKQSFR